LIPAVIRGCIVVGRIAGLSGGKAIFDSVSAFARSRRARRHLLPLLKAAHSGDGPLRVLDVGGTASFWRPIIPLLDGMNVRITVLNLEPRPAADDETFTYVVGNACALEYADGYFDVVVSNSVIEHVEDAGGVVTWRAQRQYAAEVRRVGKSFYVQAPYFWFPLEPHYRRLFFHWLPSPVQAWALMNFDLRGGRKAGSLHDAYERLNAHPRLPTFRDMACLFPDARIERERFALLTKSLTAIRLDDTARPQGA